MGNYNQLSLADNMFSAREKRSRVVVTLKKINDIVDWGSLEKIVSVIDKTKDGHGGRPRTPLQCLPAGQAGMLRMLFVQHLYNLSDPELEDQLIDRKSFQDFVGIHQGVEIPDFTVLWRFKEALIKHKLTERIFANINTQLESRNLFVKQGTAVDATLIQSTTRPLSNEKREALKESPSVQIDTDASSTSKGGKKYFGYKGHVGVDVGSKLIRKITFTTASPHDSTEFEKVLSGDERSVWADSAYVNKNMKRAARFLGIFFGVIDRAARCHPLSNRQKKRNQKKSAVRSMVEHPFAHIKTKQKWLKAKAKTLERNALSFTMNCVNYNILRSSYLLQRQVA